jgi:hypothetical protein
MLKIEDKGVFQVVDSSQVQRLTSMGWRLVVVLDNEMAMPWSDTENFQASTQHTTFNNMGVQQYGSTPCGFVTATNTKFHPHKTQMFLLMQDEESAIAILHARIQTLESEVAKTTDLKKLLGETEMARDDLEERWKTYVGDHARLEAQVSAVTKALTDYKAEVADTVAKAEEKWAEAVCVIDVHKMRRTAFERVVEGGFDDTVEGVDLHVGNGG